MSDKITGAGQRPVGSPALPDEELQVKQEQKPAATPSTPASETVASSAAQSSGAKAHAAETRVGQDLKQAAIQSELLHKVGPESTTKKQDTESAGKDTSMNKLAGYGAQTPYGTGKTLKEFKAGVKSLEGTLVKGKDGEIKGEAAGLEARARGYRYADGIGLGAQGEINAERANISGGVNKGLNVKGTEVIGGGVSADAGGAATVRAGAEGGIHAGSGQLPSIGASGEAYAGARTDAHAGAEGRVVGLSAGADGTLTASAGAEAKAQARAGLGGVDASAGAFAGARVGVSGSANVLGLGVTGSAEAMAGIGVKAQFTAGIKDGKLTVKAGFGAALGVGASVSPGFTWDFAKTFSDGKQFAVNTANFLKDQIPAVAAKISDPGAGKLAALTARQAVAGA